VARSQMARLCGSVFMCCCYPTVLCSYMQCNFYKHNQPTITFVLTVLLILKILCSVDCASRYNSCKWPAWCTILFSYMFISNLYMFRALTCSLPGELIVSIRHMVYITVCRWPSVMQVWVETQSRRKRNLSVLIQLVLLMMSTRVLETCRDLR